MRSVWLRRVAVAALCAVTLSVPIAGSAQTATVTSGTGGPSIQEAQRESAFGPKARIAVGQFKDKTGKGWWTGAIGDGMAEMLGTLLFNTGRFIVLERQALKDVIQEQDLGASGRVKQQTAAPIGEIEGAELLITGAVTEFEPGSSGIRGGIGGAGVPGVGGLVLGAIAGGLKESHLALDLRVIDLKTSRLVAATSVEGKARDFDLGGAIGGAGGRVALGGALGGWSKTPMEKALRVALGEAVTFVTTRTPGEYYHAPSAGAAVPAPPTLPPPPPPASGLGPASAPAARSGSAIAAPAPTRPTVEERLMKLDELRKKQLLTDEEYRKKREEILKEL